jgi:hypothetical protein
MGDCPFGVVSLLDMFEFSARDYIEISYNLGQICSADKGQD